MSNGDSLPGIEGFQGSIHQPVNLNRAEIKVIVDGMSKTREEMEYQLYELMVAATANRDQMMVLEVMKVVIDFKGWNDGAAGVGEGVA